MGMTGKKIFFGLEVGPEGSLSQTSNVSEFIQSTAIESESLAFDSFWLLDYCALVPPIEPFYAIHNTNEKTPYPELWTTLAAVAAKTSRIKLGSLITCINFRFPVILAKMGASLDLISQGRLIMGLGAGESEKEHFACGFPAGTLQNRLRRLEEVVQIIKRLWTEDQVFFHGRYYDINGASCYPKPVSKPHPPILIGGSGEKFTLRIVSEFADWCNLTVDGGDPAIAKAKLEVIRNYCSKLGRNPAEITKSRVGTFLVGRNRDEVRMKITKFKPSSIPDELYRKRIIAGTPDELVDRFQSYLDVGITHQIVTFLDIVDGDSMRIFAEQVIPQFS